MEGCVFCKIIDGELPAHKLYEDDTVLAILDIHPVNPGHALVIPKDKHCRTIFDITREDWLAMAGVIHTLAGAIEQATNADGVNLMMNNRSHAGQVVDHPHVHIIPRFKNDGLRHWSHSSYADGQAAAIREQILAALA